MSDAELVLHASVRWCSNLVQWTFFISTANQINVPCESCYSTWGKKTFDSCHLWDCTDLTNPRLRIRLKKKVSTLKPFQTMKQNFSRSLTHEYPCKDAPVVLYVWGKSSLPSLPHTNFFLASSPTRAAVQCGLSELSFTFDIHTSAPLEPQAWIRQAYNRPAHCPACFPLYNSWSG